MTADADLTLITGWGAEGKFIEPLLEKFPARLAGAAEFAHKRRILLLKASNDVPLDVALAAIPFEETTIERASSWVISASVSLTTCCPEDLVIHKVFEGRDQDWLDVRGILQRQREKLDFSLIFAELRPLLELKEEPENEEREIVEAAAVSAVIPNPAGHTPAATPRAFLIRGRRGARSTTGHFTFQFPALHFSPTLRASLAFCLSDFQLFSFPCPTPPPN